MTIHIDGDNISHKFWPKLSQIFRQRYPLAHIIVYRGAVVDIEVATAKRLDIALQHIFSPYKGAVDTAIIYAVAQSTAPQYIISNDKGFRTIPLITNNVTVLGCEPQTTYTNKPDKILANIFSNRTKLLAANVGQVCDAKKHGFSSLKRLVDASTSYKLCNNYIIRII